ncbi:hypothetical protein RHS03_00838, partial [Rhizoctonia solani]
MIPFRKVHATDKESKDEDGFLELGLPSEVKSEIRFRLGQLVLRPPSSILGPEVTTVQNELVPTEILMSRMALQSHEAMSA